MIGDISVVIPYYEAAATIRRALDSVLAQTLPVREVIIVNDGSNFALLQDAVCSLASDFEIILIDLGANFGAAQARNVGVERAKSMFVAFLDADDVWHPEKLAVQHAFMMKTGAFLSCHGYAAKLSGPMLLSESDESIRKLDLIDFVWGNQIFTPTVMVKRSNFVPFDRSLSRSEDLKCWLSNFSNGSFYRLGRILAGGFKAPVGESGLSGSYSLMHREYIAAWSKLYREKRVGLAHYLSATIIEQLKYPIRLCLGRLRRAS
jgi:glycosyltransferase involved in cell wall biosynthesis